MRISDWSSDVCSFDLPKPPLQRARVEVEFRRDALDGTVLAAQLLKDNAANPRVKRWFGFWKAVFEKRHGNFVNRRIGVCDRTLQLALVENHAIFFLAAAHVAADVSSIRFGRQVWFVIDHDFPPPSGVSTPLQ